MQQPDQYAVIGNPIQHSRSPEIHQQFAQQTQQNLHYGRIEAPLEQFIASVQDFFAQGGRGLNITVPFKLEAFALADWHDPFAQAAGAVNTLHKDATGKLCGYNTDGIGLVRDIQQRGGLSLAGKRVLILGAGGAARGVILPLWQAGTSEIVLSNRTISTAETIQQQLCAFAPSLPLRISRLDDLAQQGQVDLIINATSASLHGANLALPASLFHPDSLAYDMLYAATPTPFLQQAAAQGARILDGWGMLVEQAAEAFHIWRGVRPDTTPFFQAVPL